MHECLGTSSWMSYWEGYSLDENGIAIKGIMGLLSWEVFKLSSSGTYVLFILE